MSPFALFLRGLRGKRGMKQKDVADLLGYEPSYLSALERGEKGPPREDFIRRLVTGLRLDEIEKTDLQKALTLSGRKVSLPVAASKEEYLLIHELEPQLGRLTPLQIHLIRLALRLPTSPSAPTELLDGVLYPLERKGVPKM